MENTGDCQECGFVFANVSPTEIADRLRDVASDFENLLTHSGDAELVRRPDPDVWSPLEYSCHTRDVFLNLRDRVLLALVEETPEFAPVHRERRVGLARYGDEQPIAVAKGIRVAADLLAWLVAGLTKEQMQRTGIYAGVERDVLWIARQALHEGKHHAEDARRGLSGGPE